MKAKLNLIGNWSYQSFLIEPTELEKDAPPKSAVMASKWAKGMLKIDELSENQISGELSFAPGIKLSVTGRIVAATDCCPATLEATGEGLQAPTAGAIYVISGWISPASESESFPTIRGSVLAVHGPNTSPDVELGGKEIGTIGAFVLTQT